MGPFRGHCTVAITYVIWELTFFGKLKIRLHVVLKSIQRRTETVTECSTMPTAPTRDSPPPSSVRVKEGVELYLYSPSGPSLPVLRRTLPLPLPTRDFHSRRIIEGKGLRLNE
jgi:hypothetical protein